LVLGEIPIRTAGARERGAPLLVVALLVVARQQRNPISNLDQAGHALGALSVAREPEEIVGGPSKHSIVARLSALQSFRIQVSFVPPPWLELTTSEPGFSATRVRPPGT